MEETAERCSTRVEQIGPVTVEITAPEGIPLDRLAVTLMFSRYSGPLTREEALSVVELMGGVSAAEPITPGAGADDIRWKSPAGAALVIGLPDDPRGEPAFVSSVAAELAARQEGQG